MYDLQVAELIVGRAVTLLRRGRTNVSTGVSGCSVWTGWLLIELNPSRPFVPRWSQLLDAFSKIIYNRILEFWNLLFSFFM